MKRLLSLILALALVIGMIPAVFATEETVIYSPKYIFNSSQLYDADGNAATGAVKIADLANYTGKSATGNWKYVAAPNLHSDSQVAESYAIAVTTAPEEDNAFIVSLDVDKSGVYSLNFDRFNSPNSSFNMPASYVYGGIIDYYIVHKDVVTANGWDVTSNAFISEMKAAASYTDAYADIKRIASYDWMQNTTSGHVNHTMSEIALNKGENYLFITINTPTPASDQSAGKTYCQLRSLAFTCEGTLNVTSAGLKAEYEVGDSFVLTATATNGTGVVDTEASSAVTYKTSNKNVATVDTDGNVAVVGEGSAIITAETYVGDVKVTDKVKVSVPVVWSPKYVFTKGAFNNVQFTDELGAASWSVKCATNSSLLNREVSTGEWIYRGGTKTYTDSSESAYTGYFNCATADLLDTSLSIYEGASESGLNAMVFEITVDKDGWYKPTFDFYKYSKNGQLNVYLVDKDEFDGRSGWDITNYSYAVNQIIKPMIDSTTPFVTITHLGSVDTYDAKATSNITTPDSYTNDKAFYIEGGKYYLFLNATQGKAGAESKYLHVSSVKLTRQPTVETTASKTTLAVGDSATLTSEVTSGENQDITATTEVTYTSSDLNVAQIENGNEIKAVGEGTAIITATAANGATDTVEIKVEAKKISLAYTTSVDEENIVVEAHKAGSVTVNAPEKTGYTFSHWVRGTADNGVWVSTDASYKFDLVSPTYLTAIYVEDGAKIVEFFNGNGELLAQKEVVDGKVEEPAEPKMVGFTFLNWILGKNGNEAIPFVNENIEKSLRVVADYAVESTKYTVDDDSNLVYDAEVVKNADSEDTVWYRGGSPVGYGKTYTYNVWANTTITSDTLTGEKTPLVYLDTAVKNVGDEKACMIEFDGAGKEIVEVGILFSTTGTPEVGSCQYKATSKTNGGDDGHGQFTAKPANNTQTVARGYIIYLDNGEYKTEYSEVLGLND